MKALSRFFMIAVAIFSITSADQFVFGPELQAGTGVRPSVAVDAQGTAHIAYFEESRSFGVTTYSVYYQKFSNGTWSDREKVYDQKAWWPQIAVSGDGDVHVVWEDEPYGMSIVYARRINGQWKTTELWGTNRAMQPRIDVDANNKAHVVFWKDVKLSSSNYGCYCRLGKSGASIVKEQTLNISFWNGNRCGDVIVDSQNRIHVFAGDMGSFRHKILSGSSWTDAAAISKPSGLVKNGESMNAALSPNGIFFAATVEAAGTSGDKVATSSTSGTNTVFADGQGGEFAYPQCVADRTVPGLSYTVWAGHSTGKSKIAALETSGAKTGPVNISQLSGTQQMAWRYSSSSAAHTRGGLWLAYENTGDRHVYIRRVQMRDKHGDITPIRLPEHKNKFGRIEVYPNPLSTSVKIQVLVRNDECGMMNVNAGIFNINGRQIARFDQFRIPYSAFHNSYTWDATNQPSGTYIIRVESGNMTMNKKIMISR
jgi:hypothetical protein